MHVAGQMLLVFVPRMTTAAVFLLTLAVHVCSYMFLILVEIIKSEDNSELKKCTVICCFYVHSLFQLEISSLLVMKLLVVSPKDPFLGLHCFPFICDL